MQSVFEYVISNPNLTSIGSLIESALKYYRDDPQSSVMKISTALEIIVDDIIRRENPVVKYHDLKGKISALNPIILPAIYNCMTQIRLLRNEGGAHPSAISRDKTSIPADSIFALSKMYEILVWYVNFDKKGRIDFAPFSEVIRDLEGVKSVVASSGENRRQTPRLNFDIVLYNNVNRHSGNIMTIPNEQLIGVVTSYLMTDLTLEEIEESIFGNKTYEGNAAYTIIKLYKKWGLNNLWRKFIRNVGIEMAVRIISNERGIFSDDEAEKMNEIVDFLKSIALVGEKS